MDVGNALQSLTALTTRGPSAAGNLVNVTVRSQLFSPVTITPTGIVEDGGAGAPPPSPPSGWTNLLLRIVRPSLEVDTPLGTERFAPFGEPGANYGPAIVGGALAFALGVGAIVGKVVPATFLLLGGAAAAAGAGYLASRD